MKPLKTRTPKSESKVTSPKQRIAHFYHSKHDADADGCSDMPRGWIDPDGRFRASKLHWITIRPLIEKKRVAKKHADKDDAELGERAAQKAYALGWISVSHGGVLNAVGHRNAFHSKHSPAIVTLRRLLARVPHFSVRIETQIGKIDPKTGRHEDFDVQEYELALFVRRGTLRKISY